MTVPPDGPKAGRDLPAGLPPVERNRYFDGKFMDARDFALDTDYLLGRQDFAQRLFGGWGVAEGLDVTWAPEDGRGLVIGEGVAIDDHGRQLVVREPLRVDVDVDPRSAGALVGLRFERRAIDPCPRLFDPEEGESGRRDHEAGRWLDTVEARIFPGVSGWRLPSPWVALARLHSDGSPGACLELELAGRPDLELRPARIERISWPHGGRLDTGELWRCGAEVEIVFDRRLAPAHRGFGLGPETFLLAIGEPQGLRQPLHGEVTSDGRRAVFRIAGSGCPPLAGRNLYLTLLCDAIFDRRHRRVSSTPPWVAANLPGRPGGIFESWCRLVENGCGEVVDPAPSRGRPEPGGDGLVDLGVIDPRPSTDVPRVLPGNGSRLVDLGVIDPRSPAPGPTVSSAGFSSVVAPPPVTVPTGGLRIEKHARPAVAVPGEVITYHYRLAWSGPGDVDAVRLADDRLGTIAQGLRLRPGESRELTFQASLPSEAAGRFTSEVLASGRDGEGRLVQAHTRHHVDVGAPAAGLGEVS